MNYNQQFKGLHNCSGCSKIIPTGFETPCWTTGGNRIILNQLFCSLCIQTRGGRDFSKPYSDLNHLDLEIIDTPEFKKYMEFKEKAHSAENVKKLTKELEEDWQRRLKEEQEK